MILKYNNENGFCRLSSRTIIFLERRSVQDLTICILFSTHRMSKNYLSNGPKKKTTTKDFLRNNLFSLDCVITEGP